MRTARRARQWALIAGLASVVVLGTVLVFPFDVENTGKTEVRKESTCVAYHYAGARGVSSRVCDQYKAYDRTYRIYRYRNLLGFTWEGLGG